MFSALTVRQNIQFPLREFLNLSDRLLDELATAKLEMVGLSDRDGDKYPSEISGGMTKRAALARALALDPEIVFLDEPTSGLDPISAGDFDSLIRTLQQTLGLTVFMVTHDLDSLHAVCDRIAVLAEGRLSRAVPAASTSINQIGIWMSGDFDQHGDHGEPPAGATGSNTLPGAAHATA